MRAKIFGVFSDHIANFGRGYFFTAEYDGLFFKDRYIVEKLRDAGYKSFDVHTPFPVHGMDAAMGLSDSKLGPIVFTGGLAGFTTAFTMIWWMNGVDYPLVIGGKPPFSIPSMVPILFELTVLFSALTSVFGMFHLNRIPQHHHPIFNSKRFEACSDDKFFVSVATDDPKFDLEKKIGRAHV